MFFFPKVSICVIHAYFFCLLQLIFGSTHGDKSHNIRAVSVFRNDEVDYHKYSAVLAATEPFRVQMEKEIKDCINPFKFMVLKIKGTFKNSEKLNNLREENLIVNSACDRYERRVSEVLRSYGMNANNFNNLSKSISSQPILKHRVLLQSYFYRIAADLEANVRPSLPILPSISMSQKQSLVNIPPGSDDEDNGSKNNEFESNFIRFCKSLRVIENERLKRRESLMNTLGVRRLPDKMSDPDVIVTLSPEIQNACYSFQNQAATIISKHRLDLNEFDELYNKLKHNILFRFRVGLELKRLGSEAALARKK